LNGSGGESGGRLGGGRPGGDGMLGGPTYLYWKIPLQKQHATSGVASTPYSLKSAVTKAEEPHGAPASVYSSVPHVCASAGACAASSVVAGVNQNAESSQGGAAGGGCVGGKRGDGGCAGGRCGGGGVSGGRGGLSGGGGLGGLGGGLGGGFGCPRKGCTVPNVSSSGAPLFDGAVPTNVEGRAIKRAMKPSTTTPITTINANVQL
jgi:hypothetical protein